MVPSKKKKHGIDPKYNMFCYIANFFLKNSENIYQYFQTSCLFKYLVCGFFPLWDCLFLCCFVEKHLRLVIWACSLGREVNVEDVEA